MEKHFPFDYVDILHKTKEAIIIHGIDGKILHFNSSALYLLGLSSDQLLGKTSYDPQWKCVNSNGKELKGDEHPVAVTLKTHREVNNFTMGVNKPDGETSWILINSHPIYNDKEFSGVLVTFSDISIRKTYQDRLDLALTNTDTGVWDWNLIDNSLYLSTSWKTQLGYSDSELANSLETFKKLLHPKDIKKVFEAAALFMEKKSSEFDVRFRLLCKSGRYKWIRSSGGVIRNVDGKAIRFVGIHHDIDKLMQDEIHLRQSATIFESSHDAILITDKDNIITSVNKAFEEVTGYTQEEVIGKSPRLLKSGKHGNEYYKHMWHSINTKGQYSGEIWNKTKFGKIYPEWITIKVNKDSNGDIQNYIAIFSDISELKGYEKKLYFEANHDSLTGLINRKKFYENLEFSLLQAVRSNTKIALAFMDLDKFKLINDSYGHDVGDIILKEVAKRLSETFRDGDSISRLSGDEFGFILSNINDTNEIEIILERIIRTIKQPIKVSDELSLFITCSIGVAFYPQDGSSPDVLMKNADTAMYEAKKTRGTFSFYDQKATEYHRQQIELYQDLKVALDTKELEVYYQAQIDIESDVVTTIEALARWNHPKRGFVSPDIFIHIAEEFGLIETLSCVVIEKSIKHLLAFQKGGYLGKLAINISPKLLLQKNLVEILKANIIAKNVNPANIELEITESSIIEDLELASKNLNALKSYGFIIAIDDFGTGATSLTHLQSLPLDKIKIDKTFVDDLDIHTKNQMIVKTIIQLSENMGYHVLVEGVETNRQLRIITQLGCHEIQGFLFSKPIPFLKTKEFLKEKQNYKKLYQNVIDKLFDNEKAFQEEHEIDAKMLSQSLKLQHKELLDKSRKLQASTKQVHSIQEEFKAIFDLAPVAYVLIDEDLKILKTNDYFQALTLWKNHGYFNHYIDTKSKYKFTKWISSLNSKRVKTTKLSLDNTNTIVRVFGRAVFEEGNLRFYISMMDVTKDVQTASRLQELNTKLNESVQKEIQKNIKFQESYIKDKIEQSKFSTIGKMAAGLTHEINTPLTIIKGNLEMIGIDLENVDDKVLRAYITESVQNAFSAVDRINFITSSLRELSDSDDHPISVNIYETLVSTLQFMQNRHKHITKILIQNELFSEHLSKNSLRFMTKASAQRLEQVWGNIISNALDELVKIPDFHQRKFSIDVTSVDDYHIVTFQDNAGGFCTESIQTIFDPFTSTKRSSGIGLGLYITRKIIEEHDGYIEISNENDGARIKVALPQASESKEVSR